MPPSSPTLASSQPPATSPWYRRIPKRAVRSAVLLLGAGLAVGGLYLPWWHFERPGGTPLPPGEDLQIIPAASSGYMQQYLPVAVVAAVAGLIALILPPRAYRWLALVPSVVAEISLALATVLALFSNANPAFQIVHEGGYFVYALGCVLIVASARTPLAV